MSWAATILFIFILAGCAAESAYNNGTQLVNDGKLEQGTASLAEAVRLEPNNLEYRFALREALHRFAMDQIQVAEKQMMNGQFEVAETNLKSALLVEPGNDQAKIKLLALVNDRRHAGLLQDAQIAMVKKDQETARAKLSTVLAEDPNNAQAKALMASLAEQSAAASAPSGLAAAFRRPVTIEFHETPLHTIFEVLSRSSGLNFIFDKDVKTDQRTSVFLRNSTVQTVVNLVLLTNQLDQRVIDQNTILIYPNTAAKQHDYQPLVIKSFYLANSEAKTVASTLKTLLKLHDVEVDEKLNLVVVRDTAEGVRLAAKVVALHDIPDPEVMLEVEVLEVARSRLTDLGVDWPSQVSLAPLATATAGTLTLQNLLHLTQTTVGATVAPLTLNAQQLDTDSNILANPRIRAKNREKAKILIGDRVPIVTTTSTATGFVSDSINYIDVGLKLDVEPTIYPDDEVDIKIALEVSSIVNQITTKSGTQAYQIGTRNASTTLRLHDGENQILAGLIDDESTKTANKIPGLGSIPGLGYFLGENRNDGTKTEIVLSITPHLIRNIQRPSAADGEFEAGTEGNGRSDGGGSSSGSSLPYIPPSSSSSSAQANGPGQSNQFGNNSASSFGSNGASAYGASGGSPSLLTSSTGAATGDSTGTTSAGTAQYTWSAPPSAAVNSNFTVQLLMQSSASVVSVPISLSYDPKVLTATSVQEGTFLKQSGGQTSFTSKIDSVNGQILATDTVSGNAGATAQGSLLIINFQAKAASSGTAINIITTSPVGLNGSTVSASLPGPLNITVSQ